VILESLTRPETFLSVAETFARDTVHWPALEKNQSRSTSSKHYYRDLVRVALTRWCFRRRPARWGTGFAPDGSAPAEEEDPLLL
jgi:hypothetical protein